MRRMNIRDAQQNALSFLRQQASIIEPAVIQIAYPDIQYPTLVPVDTTGNEWAKSVLYVTSDKVGAAQFFHAQAKDVPIADVTREQHEETIELAAIGYRYNLQELAQSQMLGIPLQTDRAEAARRAYEEFIDAVALYGKTEKNWTGLLNSDSDVTVVNAPWVGTGSSPAWADKTVAQVLSDINDLLVGIWTSTLHVEMADTLLLPYTEISRLATLQVPNVDVTVMEWIGRYNVYTQQTGQQLTIRGVRGLETAGAGGSGRAVAYRRSPQVLKMHIPMTHRFLPVWQTGPLVFDVPGIFRTGPLEIRRPGSVRYMDHIIDPAYE